MGKITAAIAAILFGAILTLGGPMAEEDDPILVVTAAGRQPVAIGPDAFFALPAHRLETTTSVTDGVEVFEGPLARDVLALTEATGQTVTASALNDYAVDIPIEDFELFDVLIAHTMNGERLTARDKGPLWIVYPRDAHTRLQDIRYDYRWVWQLYRLDVR